LALILYGSRIGYILLFLIILIHFFKNLLSKEETNRIRYVLIYSIGLSILFLISFNIPIVKERFLYTIGYKYDYKFNNKEFIKHNSPEELGRLLLWQDAADLIKENPFLGYGTGATRDVLLQKYKKEDHTLFLEKRFNAHNSYLELLLSGGIILLISYLAILLVLFLKSVRKKDYVLFSFALIITITSITESLFIAQGILFISFFYCFFLIKINE
jgi:O-antigen ligase